MVSLYGALAADRVAFNSAFNRDSFLAGCGDLLDRLPDRVPPGVTALLAEKSRVIPVPVQVPARTSKRPNSGWPGVGEDTPGRPLRLLWVGRFEHDKGGDRLLAVLRLLERGGLSFELALVGQQFRDSPSAFGQIAAEFRHRLVQCGYLQSPAEYHAILCAADLVLSTTLHEFQGIAVMEAVANGCLPVVPDRLAYPEIYPSRHRYQSDMIDPAREARSAASLIGDLWESTLAGQVHPPDVSAFTRDALRGAYCELFGTSGVASG
jgi:glycosyltransferase involved in cell wall biosynthesis